MSDLLRLAVLLLLPIAVSALIARERRGDVHRDTRSNADRQTIPAATR